MGDQAPSGNNKRARYRALRQWPRPFLDRWLRPEYLDNYGMSGDHACSNDIHNYYEDGVCKSCKEKCPDVNQKKKVETDCWAYCSKYLANYYFPEVITSNEMDFYSYFPVEGESKEPSGYSVCMIKLSIIGSGEGWPPFDPQLLSDARFKAPSMLRLVIPPVYKRAVLPIAPDDKNYLLHRNRYTVLSKVCLAEDVAFKRHAYFLQDGVEWLFSYNAESLSELKVKIGGSMDNCRNYAYFQLEKYYGKSTLGEMSRGQDKSLTRIVENACKFILGAKKARPVFNCDTFKQFNFKGYAGVRAAKGMGYLDIGKKRMTAFLKKSEGDIWSMVLSYNRNNIAAHKEYVMIDLFLSALKGSLDSFGSHSGFYSNGTPVTIECSQSGKDPRLSLKLNDVSSLWLPVTIEDAAESGTVPDAALTFRFSIKAKDDERSAFYLNLNPVIR